MTAANRFPMPFVMSVERAARIIRSGLAENRACIAFPWIMHAAVRLMGLMPEAWFHRMAARMPAKAPLQ